MPEQTKTEVVLSTLRRDIKNVAANVKSMKNVMVVRTHEPSANEDHSEMVANVTLAYRALEDASMRLGKAIQAHNGGTSVYDRDTTVGA